MPVVLDKPKATKQEEFVEKQIEQARHRIRTLDFFQTGIIIGIAALAFAFTLMLIDRSVETFKGAGWISIVLFVIAAVGFVWWSLFRPSRRHINPFYAARRVEQTIPDAKNSVINYVDLEDDESVPNSVKVAIGAKAAKDMKHVDLHQAIQKRQILWLAAVAGVFLIAVVVALFLPPTRTTIEMRAPKDGNITLVQGEELRIEVELKGRIPAKGQPDAPRVRIWYNASDPGNFEERPLEADEKNKNLFGITIPAKQIRNLNYQVLAGNTKTETYEVKLKVIPQFTGVWEVDYVYPDYLVRAPEKKNDPHLVGFYNTQVTLTAHANRPVRSAYLEIAGIAKRVDATLVEGDPEAMRFKFTMEKNSTYKISFTTTENDKNPDPKPFRLSLVDPKPVLRFFDVAYDYPKYLRFVPVKVVLRDPHLEAYRGTKVTLTAHANRPVKEAKLQYEGIDQPIVGVVDEKDKTQVKFTLPPLMKDGAYRLTYTPTTGEPPSEPRVFNIRIVADEAPKVDITKPQQEEIELPVNGALNVEGIATDDHGLAKMNLRMEVVRPAPAVILTPKPYRDGISFKRESDGSYPKHLDYKEIVELAKLKATGQPGFSVQEGMVIEYWLEAIDNCDVPPGPGTGHSRKFRVKVMPPEMNPEKKKQQQQEQQQAEQEKKQHEQKQDQKNANEKREPQQPKQRDDQQPPPDQQPMEGEPKEGQPKEGQPKEGQPKDGMGEPKKDPKGGMAGGNSMPGDPPPDQDLKNQEERLKELLAKNDPMKKDPMPKDPKTDPTVKNPDPKQNPDPKDEPKNTDPKKKDPDPKKEPGAKEEPQDEKTNPKELPNPENIQKLADQLQSKDEKAREQARDEIKKHLDDAKKDRRKPDEAQKAIDQHRDKLDKPEREKFDKAVEDVAKEIQDIQREERVKQAVDKLTGNDQQQREQGQKDLEKEMRNPKNRDKVERQLQNLAGDMGQERKQQIGDAMNLAKENLKKEGDPKPPEPKKDDVDELAKKLNEGTPEEKEDAEDRLQKKAKKDQKSREEVQNKLEEFKKNIKDEQKRKDFENAMRKIDDNAAQKDQGPLKPEDVQKLAEQLKSDDAKERQKAQDRLAEGLKQMDKDPKGREQAQKQLEKTRDGIQEKNKRDQFDQALKDINDAVEKHDRQQAAAEQNRKEEIEKLAQDLNGKDQNKKEAAQQKLEEMLKDPNQKDQVKKDLEKTKQAQGDPQAKQNLDDAVKKAEENIAQNGGGMGQPKKDELDKLAQDLNSKDQSKKDAAEKKLEEMLRDPASREQVKKGLEDSKEAKGDPQAKQNINDAIKKAEDNLAKKGGGMGQPNKDELEKLAQDLNSKDQGKKDAAEKKLEDLLKDPANREQVKKGLDESKTAKGDPQAKQNIDDAIKNAEEKLAKKEPGKSQPKKDELDKLAQDLNSKDPDKKAAAEKQLEDLLKDPANREQVKKGLENSKEAQGDPQAKQNINDAIKKAEENVAKNEGKGLPKKEDLEQLARDLNDKNPAKQEAAKDQLREALKDPKTRGKVEDLLNKIKDELKDPAAAKNLADAIKAAKDELAKLDPKKSTEPKLDPKEIEKLVNEMMGKDPKAAEEAKKKIEEMLKDPEQRAALDKALDELKKGLKDEQARKDLDKELKDLKDHAAKEFDPKGTGKTGHVKNHDGKKTGDNVNQDPKEGPLADLKNKVKAGELLLEQFKRNISKEEFRKQLGWTEAQIAEFQRKYEQQIALMKKNLELAEKGELPLPRVTGGGSLPQGPERINLDPRDNSNPLQGGKYIAPPGFGDPYKRFTEEIGGGGVRPLPPPKK